MPLIIYIALIAGVLLSGLAVLVFRINSQQLKLLLSFSGAFLFAICALDLIPEVYSGGSKTVGIFILIGFFLQIGLEFFSEGIEHGHTHHHGPGEKAFPITVMLGLSIHSFLEGMPLAGFDGHYNKALFTGILLHNVPIAIALMTMLLDSHMKRGTAVLLLVLFACMTPLGALTSHFMGHDAAAAVYYNNIMGLVVGIFLHISTTILFESSENHRFNLIKFITILVGAGLAFLVL